MFCAATTARSDEVCAVAPGRCVGATRAHAKVCTHGVLDPGRPEPAMTRPTFVSLCEQTIRRVAAQYWLQPQEWDDFAQDAWLDILTSLERGRYDPRQGRLENWLYVVVRNSAISAAAPVGAMRRPRRNSHSSCCRAAPPRIRRNGWIARVASKQCGPHWHCSPSASRPPRTRSSTCGTWSRRALPKSRRSSDSPRARCGSTTTAPRRKLAAILEHRGWS